MSLKQCAMLVSINVNKPQLTKQDEKATRDAERANNASNAGEFRKRLYPKDLIAPILQVESAARAYINSSTYMWNRGEQLLPAKRFMKFADRMAQFELEFEQAVTVFLNNFSNVLLRAEEAQGDMFDRSQYPDLSQLKAQFKLRVHYKPVTSRDDFRIQMVDDETARLLAQVDEAALSNERAMLTDALGKLKQVVSRLNEKTGEESRMVYNKRKDCNEIKPPIFRDSIVDNIHEEIEMVREIVDALPANIIDLVNKVEQELTVPAAVLRNDDDKRATVHDKSKQLLADIDNLLGD